MNWVDIEFFTLDDVAFYLKAGKKTAFRLAQQGTILGIQARRDLQISSHRAGPLDCCADTRGKTG